MRSMGARKRTVFLRMLRFFEIYGDISQKDTFARSFAKKYNNLKSLIIK